MTLRPLPPLPVGIGQLREAAPKAAPPLGTKSNPFAVQKSEQVLKRVGGELPAETLPNPTTSRAMLVQSPSSISLRPFDATANETSTPEAAVTPPAPTSVQGPEVQGPEVQGPEVQGPEVQATADEPPTPAFQRVVAQQAPTFLMPSTEINFAAPASLPKENPWVKASSATVPSSGSDASNEVPLAPNEADISFDTTVAESDLADQSEHFSLSDSQSPDESPLAFRLNDDNQPRSATVAPLLQVAPPVLLQAAAPVSLDEDRSSSVAEDGDARSFADVNRSTKSRIATATADRLTSGERSVGGNAVSSSAPIVLESPRESDHVADASQLNVATIPTPVRDETSRIQLPVPQVYRPRQSLVIDVPVAQVAAVSLSKDDWEGTGSTRDPIFCGEVSQIMTLSTAQTLAHTPDEPVRRVQLENRDICEAVLVGTHKLLLIGRATGSTRMAVWSGEASEAKLYEIQVAAQADATPGSSLDAISKRLTETISATYPNCRVRVVTHGDGLAVIGKAGDSKSAREILRLVRSACLKSVSDQLEVR